MRVHPARMTVIQLEISLPLFYPEYHRHVQQKGLEHQPFSARVPGLGEQAGKQGGPHILREDMIIGGRNYTEFQIVQRRRVPP